MNKPMKKLTVLADLWRRASVVRYWLFVAALAVIHYKVTHILPVTLFFVLLAIVFFIGGERRGRKRSFTGVDWGEGDKTVVTVWQDGKPVVHKWLSREELEKIEAYPMKPMKYSATGELTVTRVSACFGCGKEEPVTGAHFCEDCTKRILPDKILDLCQGCGESPRAKDESLCAMCIEHRDLLKNQ